MSSILVSSCWVNNNNRIVYDVQGYSPIYANLNYEYPVSFSIARKTTNAGKIYSTTRYIFQNEIGEGFHVIQKNEAEKPQKIGFLSIPFSTEITLVGNYLYTNSVTDLVTIDVSTIQHPKLVSRIKNVFPLPNQNHPPFFGYFNCSDLSQGVVVEWKFEMLKQPKCRR